MPQHMAIVHTRDGPRRGDGEQLEQLDVNSDASPAAV